MKISTNPSAESSFVRGNLSPILLVIEDILNKQLHLYLSCTCSSTCSHFSKINNHKWVLLLVHRVQATSQPAIMSYTSSLRAHKSHRNEADNLSTVLIPFLLISINHEYYPPTNRTNTRRMMPTKPENKRDAINHF